MRVEIEGVDSTAFGINELPKKLAKRVVSKSVRAGGSVWLKAAKATAPRVNGTFKRSLILTIKQFPDGARAAIGQNRDAKGTKKKKGFNYGAGISGRGDVVPTHFVENPIKEHRVAIKSKTVLAFATPTGLVFMGRAVTHPGTRGQHFLRKAAESTSDAAVSAVTSRMATETVKEGTLLGFTT